MRYTSALIGGLLSMSHAACLDPGADLLESGNAELLGPNKFTLTLLATQPQTDTDYSLRVGFGFYSSDVANDRERKIRIATGGPIDPEKQAWIYGPWGSGWHELHDTKFVAAEGDSYLDVPIRFSRAGRISFNVWEHDYVDDSLEPARLLQVRVLPHRDGVESGEGPYAGWPTEFSIGHSWNRFPSVGPSYSLSVSQFDAENLAFPVNDVERRIRVSPAYEDVERDQQAWLYFPEAPEGQTVETTLPAGAKRLELPVMFSRAGELVLVVEDVTPSFPPGYERLPRYVDVIDVH